MAILHLPILHHYIEACNERTERSWLRYLAILALDGFTHAFMRISAENEVSAFHFGFVGEVHLLGQAHVCNEEDHGTLLVVPQDADILRHIGLRLGEPDATAVSRRLTLRCEGIVVSDEADLDARDVARPVGLEDHLPGQVRVRIHASAAEVSELLMVHVRADLSCTVPAEVLQHGLLAVDHFPVARKDQVVADRVHQRHDRAAFALRCHTTTLEAIATVDDDGVLGILIPQRIDHRLQHTIPTALLVDGFAVLQEELIVGMQLGMDVARMQDGELLRLALLDGPATNEFVPTLRITQCTHGHGWSKRETGTERPQ